jgi:hypothetical protein
MGSTRVGAHDRGGARPRLYSAMAPILAGRVDLRRHSG